MPDGEGNLGGREAQGLLLADQPFAVAGDGDLEAVQHPGHAQRDDQAGVEPGPAQAVEPSRDEAPDDPSGCWSRSDAPDSSVVVVVVATSPPLQ